MPPTCPRLSWLAFFLAMLSVSCLTRASVSLSRRVYVAGSSDSCRCQLPLLIVLTSNTSLATILRAEAVKVAE